MGLQATLGPKWLATSKLVSRQVIGCFFWEASQQHEVLCLHQALRLSTGLPAFSRVQESCFLRYSFNDQNLITENYESCNSLAEYQATIADAQSCSPGLNGCYNAQGTKLTCCPGQCGPYADSGNTATCA